MKTSLEKTKPIKHKLNVEVPAERAKKSAEFALSQMQKETAIKGFRKGQAPFDILRRHLGAEAEKEILKRIIQDSYMDAVKQEKAMPVSNPSVQHDSNYTEGAPFIYSAEFEVMPEVAVPDYEGLSLTREKVEVSEEEIEREIKRIRHAMTQLEPDPQGEIGPDRVAMVDFSGTVDGKPFKGSEAKNFVVDFGALLPAFEEKIKGMKKGEERTITFAYPKNYFNKDIAGKEGIFKVKANDIRKKVVPAVNDEFAKTLGDFKTMDDVKKDVKDRISAAKEEWQKKQLGAQAIKQLVEKNIFDIPETMIEDELETMLGGIARQMEARGQKFEEAGIDASAFVKEHYNEATMRVRGYLIALAISKAAGITVTDEEISAKIAFIARQAKQSLDKVKANFEKEEPKNQLKSHLLYEKTLDFIVQKAKVKTIKAKKEKN